MAAHVSRLEGAIEVVIKACATAADVPVESIMQDEDLIFELALDSLERESLSLILEEIFGAGVSIPDELWNSPLYRTPAGLAEWCIRKAEEVAFAESKRQRRHA